MAVIKNRWLVIDKRSVVWEVREYSSHKNLKPGSYEVIPLSGISSAIGLTTTKPTMFMKSLVYSIQTNFGPSVFTSAKIKKVLKL